jgi:hypothetical protein
MQSRGRVGSWTSETSSLTSTQPSTTLSCGRLSSMMCQCFAASARRSTKASPPQTMRANNGMQQTALCAAADAER